jgi:hypothetical protein
MPSLLETFFFEFDADTSKLKKGLKDSDDLTDKLGKKMEGLDRNAKKVGAAFIDLAKNASAALAGIVALGAVKTMITNSAEQTFQLKQQAAAFAISTEAMSAWQHAIVTAGGTAAGATESLSALHSKLVELARMPGGMTPDGFMLQRMGLNASDMKKGVSDPLSAMSKLSDKFSTLSAVQQQFVGKRLGFDQGTITLLAQGRRAFDEHIARMKELGVVTQAQAEAAAKFKYQTAELGIVFDTVARETSSVLLPPLTWLLEKIEGIVLFLREHKNFVTAFFVGLGVVAADVLVPAFASAAVAVWAFLAPILAGPALIVAIVAAIALLYDDVKAFMNGQKSLIGELAKKWPWFGDVVRATVDLIIESLKLLNAGVKDMASYFVALSQFLVDVFTMGPTKALDKLNEKVRGLFKDLAGHFGSVVNGAKNMWAAVTGNGPDEKASADRKAAMSKSQTERGKYIADKLVKMGWTPEQAAGMAGSLIQESGGDPGAKNSIGAQGIGQWLGSRKKDFEKYAGHSLEQSTLDEQIAFMNYELTSGKEQGAGKRLKGAQTPEEAARIHSQYYERPGAAEANVAKREAYADMIAKAQGHVDMANNSVVNGQNSNVIANSRTANRSTTITTGDTHIHTAATDPKELAKGYSSHLQTQLRSAQDQDDDGVMA